jgi:hypothetical protein
MKFCVGASQKVINWVCGLKINLSLCFLTEHHAIKAYWGVEVWLHSFFDLSTRCRWVVSFTLRLLYSQGKSPWNPLDRRLGEPQSRSGCGGEEKNSQPLTGTEPKNPARPACSLALYRLNYYGAYVCRLRVTNMFTARKHEFYTEILKI